MQVKGKKTKMQILLQLTGSLILYLNFIFIYNTKVLVDQTSLIINRKDGLPSEKSFGSSYTLMVFMDISIML